MEAGADQATVLTSENGALRAQLTEANVLKQQAASQLQSLQSQVADLTSKEAELTAAKEELEAEGERLGQENGSLRQANANLVQAKADLQKQLTQLKGECRGRRLVVPLPPHACRAQPNRRRRSTRSRISRLCWRRSSRACVARTRRCWSRRRS